MTSKTICKTHEQAFDLGGECPWCEPKPVTTISSNPCGEALKYALIPKHLDHYASETGHNICKEIETVHSKLLTELQTKMVDLCNTYAIDVPLRTLALLGSYPIKDTKCTVLKTKSKEFRKDFF